MKATEIFKIDASWAEKLTKTRVQFLLTPSVVEVFHFGIDIQTQYSSSFMKICRYCKQKFVFIDMIPVAAQGHDDAVGEEAVHPDQLGHQVVAP